MMTTAVLANGMASVNQIAKQFVACYFSAINREDLASLVLEDKAEDFAELEAASQLLSAYMQKIARYEMALAQYADPNMWDDTTPGGTLANHDAGEMARNVLVGRPPFFHRD